MPEATTIATAILATAATCGAGWVIWRWPLGQIVRALRTIAIFAMGKPPKGDTPGRKGILEWQDDEDRFRCMVVTNLANLNRHVGNGEPIPLRVRVDAMAKDLEELRGATGRKP